MTDKEIMKLAIEENGYCILNVKYYFKKIDSNQLDHNWGESIGWVSLWNNLPNSEDNWKKEHYEFDENIVFYCDGLKELKQLMNQNNNEDIYIKEILDIGE